MARSTLYINTYMTVTGMVGVKHGSFKDLRRSQTFFRNNMSTVNVFRKVCTMLASELPAVHHVCTRL